MKLLFQVEFILQGSLSSIFKAIQLSQSGISRKSEHIRHMYIQTSAHIMSIPDEFLQSEHIHVTSRQIQAKNTQLALQESLLFVPFSSFCRCYSSPPPSAPRPPSPLHREGPGEFLAFKSDATVALWILLTEVQELKPSSCVSSLYDFGYL